MKINNPFIQCNNPITMVHFWAIMALPGFISGNQRIPDGEAMIRGIPPTGTGQRDIRQRAPGLPLQRREPRFQGFSGFLFKTLPPSLNLRVAGMALEDFTARIMVWLIYIPQGVMSILYRQNPFETWGRNILAWLGSVSVTMLGKHPKHGFNAIFNRMMIPRMQKPIHWSDRLFNRFRPRANYLELLHEAGVNLKAMGYKGDFTRQSLAKAVREKPFWNSLDVNEKMMLLSLRQTALQQGRRQKAQSIEEVLKKASGCKMLSVGTSAVIMALAIGVFLQKAVFKFISPLDRHLVPRTRMNKDGQPPGLAPSAVSASGLPQLSPRYRIPQRQNEGVRQ